MIRYASEEVNSDDDKVKKSSTKGNYDQFQKKNLFNAFHSRLFVDDCDLNVKIQALNEI